MTSRGERGIVKMSTHNEVHPMTDSLNDQKLILDLFAKLLDRSDSRSEIQRNLRSYLGWTGQSYKTYYDFAGFSIDYSTVRSFYNFQAEFLACCS